MSDELKDICGVCTAFWTDRGGYGSGKVVQGECRATPPVPSSRFAKVKSNEWCRDGFKGTKSHSMAKARAGKEKKGKKDGSEGTGSEE